MKFKDYKIWLTSIHLHLDNRHLLNHFNRNPGVVKGNPITYEMTRLLETNMLYRDFNQKVMYRILNIHLTYQEELLNHNIHMQEKVMSVVELLF